MCIHFNRVLEKQDRYHVYCEELNNCVLCLVDNRGSMSQEEVAKYLGISKMRVSQIEQVAKKKMTRRSRLFIKS